MKQVILTGDRPTGRLHVGHYVGSLKERVRLQNSGLYDEIYIMIADAQALTDNAEHPEKVRQNIMQVALDYLSCGLDPEKSTLFIQSMVPELTELTFYYMNLVTVSRVQRNPTVKAEIQMRNFEASIPVISPRSARRQFPWARIRSPCWNSVRRSSINSIPYTGRRLPIPRSFFRRTSPACVCRALTARRK